MTRIMERITGLFTRPQSNLFKAASPPKSSRRRSGSPIRKSSTTLGTVTSALTTPTNDTTLEDDQPLDQATQLRNAVAEVEVEVKEPLDLDTLINTEADDIDAAEQTTVDPDPETEVGTRPASVRDFLPSRKRDRNEMKAKSYDQVITLIERIGEHLDTQAERSDRMVTLLERLPDAIDALPEIRRNGEQLTSAIETHFAGQNERDSQLRDTIAELSVGASKQAEALTLIHQEVQAGHQREAEMAGVMADFRQTLSSLDHTNEQSVGVLKNLVVRSRESESKFAGILFRQNRTLMIVAGAAVLSSLAGLTIAVIALIKIVGA